MNKREYAQANKDWLVQKAKEEGVQALPKGVLYKVLTSGEKSSNHPSSRSIVTVPKNNFQMTEISKSPLFSRFY